MLAPITVVVISTTNNYIMIMPTNLAKDLVSKAHWVRYNADTGKRTK